MDFVLLIYLFIIIKVCMPGGKKKNPPFFQLHSDGTSFYR